MEEKALDADVAPLVHLGPSCEKLLLAVEDHWREKHLTQPEVESTNPLFVVTWQVLHILKIDCYSPMPNKQ